MDTLEQRIVAAWLRIGSALRKQAWGSADRLGLTPTQVEILRLLSKRPSGLRLSELAAELALTPATASDSVAALVRKGLTRKEAAAGNARAVAISLTPAGADAAAEAATWTAALEDAVSTLARPEQEIMFKGLIQVIRALQHSGAVSVARMCVNCRYFEAQRYEDGRGPHHCSLVQAPLREDELRVDCAEHERAGPELHGKQWAAFLKRIPMAPEPGKEGE